MALISTLKLVLTVPMAGSEWRAVVLNAVLVTHVFPSPYLNWPGQEDRFPSTTYSSPQT